MSFIAQPSWAPTDDEDNEVDDDWADEDEAVAGGVQPSGFVDHFAQRLTNPQRFTPPQRPPPPQPSPSPAPPPLSPPSTSAVVTGSAAIALVGLAAALVLTVGRPQLLAAAETETAVGRGARMIVGCADGLHERWHLSRHQLRPGRAARVATSEMDAQKLCDSAGRGAQSVSDDEDGVEDEEDAEEDDTRPDEVSPPGVRSATDAMAQERSSSSNVAGGGATRFDLD